jgi:hypothetical protein
VPRTDYLVQLTKDAPVPLDDQDSYWTHYAEGSLMAFLQMSRVIKEGGSQAPFLARSVINAFVAGIHVSVPNSQARKPI